MTLTRRIPTPAAAAIAAAAPLGERALIDASRAGAAWALASRASWTTRRRRTELLTWAIPPAPGVRVMEGTLGGRPSERYESAHARRGGVLLYLHGGGFTVGSPRGHRSMVTRLAAATGLVVHSLDYRLAPEHPFPAALDDVWSAYLELREVEEERARHDGDRAQVVVGGDSAGGALSLSLAVRALARDVPLPAALALVCPVADLTEDHGPRRPYGLREPLLTRERMDVFAGSYAAGCDRTDPELSPLLADDDVLGKLPPVVLDSAGDDPLRLDAQLLAERLTALDVPLDHVHHEGRFHDFHLLAGVVAPASAAVEGLGARLRAALAMPVV
ncbi:alpha/beta hydrolase [Nocardioides sp. LML1-1-1.1]|uniref:alpha/beta hydrolase n=1 Tax=Nocardioides sp. LML1-1-1.1 TaxID=3135248 RepID=UPI003441FAB5